MTRLRCLFICFALLLTLVVTAQEEPAITQPHPRPVPLTTLDNGGLTLERYFASLMQGQVGLLHLIGDDIHEARALFRNHEYRFVPLEGDGWYALVVADIDAQPRDYPLAVLAQKNDGTTLDFEALITVESAGFVRQNFAVPANLGYLIDPEVERNEYARLDSIIQVQQPERLWDAAGFALPLDAPYSARFGQYRILNQTVQTRHTGWDQTAPVGTPIGAIAAGEVVFAGQLDIRGNYILLHHGWGIYSGYAHLSQINVEVGQTVQQGQIIGISGNTGRSSGPHLHWEIVVNGEWIDGRLFLEMWLP